MKQFTLIAMVLLLSACGTSPRQAQEALASVLPDPRFVSYRDIQGFPGGTICGEYSALDPMGNPAGFRSFIYRDNTAWPYPSEDDTYIFCSDNPAERVEEIAGIAPMNPDNSALIQVREDLYGLQDALERYYSDNTAYPTTDQGIIALHKRAVGDHSPKVFPQEGYVQREPLDPWGRLYVLESEPFAGIKPSYKLFTLGADGKVGGRGPDADISTTQLKYLDLL